MLAKLPSPAHNDCGGLKGAGYRVSPEALEEIQVPQGQLAGKGTVGEVSGQLFWTQSSKPLQFLLIHDSFADGC